MSLFSKGVVVAAAAFGALAVQSAGASAMPIDLAPAAVTHTEASGLQQAYWHGGWHHHYGWHRGWGWRRPFYGYHRPYYGFHRPFYGWHRPWGWHHHYGWHRHWR